MFGDLRFAPFRGVLVLGVGLLLLSTYFAAPVFMHGSAAETAFGSPAFQTLWSSIEPVVPNFWGPTVQPARQEPYREATNGSRLVQYFDKARMEQTTASGPVTNGLLTVELITGQRQMGDTSYVAFSPSALPIVGDPTNTWPPYSALGGGVFAAKVGQSGEPSRTVYKPGGTFGLNPGLGADPGAQFGAYQSDPGGKYAHNIPIAFSSYLAALPIPWLSTMGLPLTEAFWVNVIVGGNPTWVLVQPFERRVLSYTPTNPAGFQVEMGNIGQHYYRWRYVTNPGGSNVLAPGATATATSQSPTQTSKPSTTTPTNTPKPKSPILTTSSKTVRATLSRVVVGAAPAYLTPSVIKLDSSTVTLTLAYDGSSNAITSTAHPTNWVRDPTNATASSTSASDPLSLTDKQTTLTLTAKATIPFVDSTTSPLVVTLTQKISPSDYTPGMTFTSPPLSNAHTPGYSVTMTFTVALSG